MKKKLLPLLLLSTFVTHQKLLFPDNNQKEQSYTNKMKIGAAIAAPSFVIALGLGTYAFITLKSMKTLKNQIGIISHPILKEELKEELKTLKIKLVASAVGAGVCTTATLAGLGIIGWGFWDRHTYRKELIQNHEELIVKIKLEYEKVISSDTSKKIKKLKNEKEKLEKRLSIWQKALKMGRKRKEEFEKRIKENKASGTKFKKWFKDQLGEDWYDDFNVKIVDLGPMPKTPREVGPFFANIEKQARERIKTTNKKLLPINKKLESFSEPNGPITQLEFIETKYKRFVDGHGKKTKIKNIPSEQDSLKNLKSLFEEFAKDHN